MTAKTIDVAMRWSDMDAYGHVNNTDLMRYLEQARILAIWVYDVPPGTGYLVVRHEVEYVRPLDYRMDGVKVDIWVTHIGGAGFDLGYSVWADVDGEHVEYAKAASTMVTFDFPTNRPRRLDDGERQALSSMSGPPVAFRRTAR